MMMPTVYTTCPASHDCPPEKFRQSVIQAAAWTEAAGCRGMLIYSDNALADPWATAQLVLGSTEHIVPMVAVNPVYMHPFSVARMVSTIAFIHERQVDLNFVSGGFSRHIHEIGCPLDHDQRYDHLTEYAQVVGKLLAGRGPAVYHQGSYYKLNAAAISPPLDTRMAPRIFVSGASEACHRAQAELGATRLAYPREIRKYVGCLPLANSGIRLGIIARETSAEAWRTARERFPSSPVGEEFHDLAAKHVESHWHVKLSQDAQVSHAPEGAYWLYPFRAYHTFCPYFVGDFAEVSSLLSRYLTLGVSTVILDFLSDFADLQHAMAALSLAHKKSETPQSALPAEQH
jgi:alkanesulfonate monooxygenase